MGKRYHEQADPSTSSDGYTKIPHDILEMLARTNLSSQESRVVMVILRMTFGWHKDADTISNLQFRNATGIKDRGNIYRAVRKLEERQIIVVCRDYSDAPTYRINKNLAEWALSSPQTTPRKKRKSGLHVVHTDHGASSAQTTPLYSAQTTHPWSQQAPSEDTGKKIKEIKDTAPGRGSLLDNWEPKKVSDPEEAAKRKELSRYRNLMAKSGLYTEEELSSFLDKSLEDLRAIDHQRFLERNPDLQ